MSLIKTITLRPKSLILIFIAIAIIVISSALFELSQSKNELYDLMADQSHSLLEATIAASNNALLSYETIDAELKNRLLNNANILKILYNNNQVNDKLLFKIANENGIHRINIFYKNGTRQFSSHKQMKSELEENEMSKKILGPIFNNNLDTLILGVKAARFNKRFHFAVAVSAKNRSAIVLNIDAEKLLYFRKQIGFGSLLKKVTQSNKIIYAALQDSNNILAASGNVVGLESFEESVFLKTSFNDSTFTWRIIKSDSLNIFEAVHPFIYKNRIVGLFRLGLSLDSLNAINDRITRRIVIIGIILFILGSLLLSYIFTRQNFEILQKNFNAVEEYSNKVIENVNDAVIVLNEKNIIKIFNSSAQNLFNKDSNSVIKQPIDIIVDSNFLKNISGSVKQIEPHYYLINNSKKYLQISKSIFEAKDNSSNIILVIHDLTKQKIIEEQMQRKERLVAMGELASGVAHEIRNPLNTISIITQQLNKDFEPIERQDEFHSLANLVSKEIKRINNTVISFLRFSKPEKIELNEFILSELITQIENQYKPMLNNKSIIFEKEILWDGIVNWDKKQIQQVIMNLIQNSFDAIETNGIIKIKCYLENDEYIKIELIDNGLGIPNHILNKIFNLYFTTKAKGTGIGLSMVQKIIIEHAGTINFESEKNIETVFIITLPIKPVLT